MSRNTVLAALGLAVAAPALAAPELIHRGSVVIDYRSLGGDNDRRAEPGETFDLVLSLGNEGDAGARRITATLASSDPQLVVAPAPASASFPDIPVDGRGEAAAPYFRLTADPAIACGKPVALTLSLAYEDDLGAPFAASATFLVFVGEPLELAHEDFDTGPGGWKEDPASTGIGGRWVNAAPEPYSVGPELAQPGRDVTWPDVSCFYTGQLDDDVDGGNQILRSRTYDLSGRSNVWLSWHRWFFTDDGAGADSYLVRISGDGGGSWTDVERITSRANAWTPVAFRIDTLVAMSADVVIEVIVEDGGADSTTEGAIDELYIHELSCGVDPPEAVLAAALLDIDDAVDPLCSDADQVPDAGETFDLVVTVTNLGNDPAVNARAALRTPLPAGITAVGPNPLALGTIADNGGTAVASFRLQVDPGVACRTPVTLDVDLGADPPSRAAPAAFPLVLEEDVNQPLLEWYDDFDSGLADWTVNLYGLNDDWGPGVKLEDCARVPGTPPQPARRFWYTGQTGIQTDCQVNPYGLDDDSAIRSPRIDTGYVRPLLLRLEWAHLLTLTPGEADHAEVWIDHDDDGVFTRVVRFDGQVTTNGDTLDAAAIDLQNNPDRADLTASRRHVTLEFRHRSDSSDGNGLGKPLALGWIVDNVRLIWTDADGRTCDANVCSGCQANATIQPSKTQACAGEVVTLDGSGSTLDGCPAPGVAAYEWLRDGVPFASGPASINVSEPLAGSHDWTLTVTCSTLAACRSSSVQKIIVVDCPNCAATIQLAAAPDEACAGQSIPLDASASTVVNCPAPGVRQFQWYRDGVPSSVAPTYTASEAVAGTYAYRVEVYCSSDPTCQAETTHSIRFDPDGTPLALGNVVRARRAGRDVELVWRDSQPLARSWTVYRADSKVAVPIPFAGVGSPWVDPLAVDFPPSQYHYTVRARSCSGLEGP